MYDKFVEHEGKKYWLIPMAEDEAKGRRFS
jgi:hypothetical protein